MERQSWHKDTHAGILTDGQCTTRQQQVTDLLIVHLKHSSSKTMTKLVLIYSILAGRSKICYNISYKTGRDLAVMIIHTDSYDYIYLINGICR